jgi:hypothetical protein
LYQNKQGVPDKPETKDYTDLIQTEIEWLQTHTEASKEEVEKKKKVG